VPDEHTSTARTFTGLEGSLDIEQPEALVAYLRAQELIRGDEEPIVRVLAGGVSNRTVWVGRESGEAWVLKQALAKLRVQVDWFSSPERIHREAAGLRWLNRLAPPGSVPGFVCEDFEQHVLIMQAVPQPHANWKHLLLAGDLQPDHVAQFGSLLGTIHGRAAGQREVEAAFANSTFFESLRLEPYYAYTARQVPEAANFLHALAAETRERRHTLVHGDYSPKNILVQDGRLVLLDHEVIHYGDPAFDLGFSLTHLLSKALHLSALRGRFAAAAVGHWEAYRRAVGRPPWLAPLEPRAVRHTLACLLARVAGRSPLEYLDAAERARQQAVVIELLAQPPASVAALTDRFVEGIEQNADR
jgi:aminoglycoside phosphotransferase (APT) family kinase protein